MRTAILGWGLAMGLMAGGSAQGAPGTDQAAALQAIGEKALATGQAPGFAFGVVSGGRLAFAQGYGLADVAAGVKVTPETRFVIGSVTKQFTAALVLKLVEQGKVGLDDALAKYVPELPNARAITLRMLLNQTSGLHNYPNTREHEWPLNGEIAPGKVLAILATDKPDFAPGERFQYSNTNYFALAVVVERVTQEAYATVLQKEIFGPLGMTSSGSGLAAERGKAVAYSGGKTGVVLSTDLFMGAGSITSTVEDMARWDAGLLAGKVLGPAELKLMWDAGTDAAGRATSYAMGWVPATLDGRREVWHNGLTPGAGGYCFNAVFPEDGLAVIVLSNDGGFRPVPETMVRATLEARVPGAAQSARSTPPAEAAGGSAAGADPAQVAAAKALALKVYGEIRAGKVDPALLTPAMAAGLTPEKIAPMAPVLAQLGEPQKLVLKAQAARDGGVAYEFRATFASAELTVRMFVTGDGRVGGYFLAP